VSPFYAVLSFLLIALWPISVGSAAFIWRLYREDRQDGRRARLRLSLVLAATGSAGAAVQSFLALVTILALMGRGNIVRGLLPAVFASFIVLGLIPITNAAYLRWLRSRARGE
jgi:hypothetical protein